MDGHNGMEGFQGGMGGPGGMQGGGMGNPGGFQVCCSCYCGVLQNSADLAIVESHSYLSP